MHHRYTSERTAYAERHTTPPDALLRRLERATHLTQLHPQMLSDSLQGQLLALLSALVQPRRVLEVGCFTGYSALCLAKGLTDGGILHTIEINEELETFIRAYIAESGNEERIILHIGDARHIIPTLDETFDLVLLDARKDDYPHYYEMILPKMRSGALLLADNVLWDDKVLDEKKDRTTTILDAFNKALATDDRVEVVLLPLRDGLSLVRKR